MNLLNHQQREAAVNKIIAGFDVFTYGDEPFFLHNPDRTTRALASICFQKNLEDAIYSNWLTDAQTSVILTRAKLIEPEIDKILKELSKNLDDLKVELYKNSALEKRCIQLKRQIKAVKESILKQTNTKHSLDHLTSYGYASMIKMQYLITMSIYNKDNQRIYKHDEFYDADCSLVDAAMRHQNTFRLDAAEYRELVRNEPWHSYWSANKENVFGCPAVDLSDDQRMLILYSKMYESVYNHPDCPAEEIINDDDMLDGWMLENRRQSEKDKKGKQVEDMLGKNKNAQEVYLMAGTKDEAKQIDNLNSLEGKMIKKGRQAVINKKGEVSEQDLPDVKMDIAMKSTRQAADTMKQRK